eukprot:gene24268-9869_t
MKRSGSGMTSAFYVCPDNAVFDILLGIPFLAHPNVNANVGIIDACLEIHLGRHGGGPASSIPSSNTRPQNASPAAPRMGREGPRREDSALLYLTGGSGGRIRGKDETEEPDTADEPEEVSAKSKRSPGTGKVSSWSIEAA